MKYKESDKFKSVFKNVNLNDKLFFLFRRDFSRIWIKHIFTRVLQIATWQLDLDFDSRVKHIFEKFFL
jgi:hypothetical protein